MPTLRIYFWVSIIGALFALAIYSIAMMFSSLFSTRGKPSGITTSLLAMMYAAGLVSKFQKSLANIKYASFFHYFDYTKALIEHKIEPLSILVFVIVIVVASIIGAIAFNQRDIST